VKESGRPQPCPSSPRALRQSYQLAAMSPVAWSTTLTGKNWLPAVCGSFSGTARVQVLPLLPECWNMMFRLLLFPGAAGVQTAYTRP